MSFYFYAKLRQSRRSFNMKKSIFISCILLCVSLSAGAEVLNYQKVKDLAKEVLQENNFSLTTDKIGDIESFCPLYKQLNSDDRNDFFANLVAQMSLYESNYNTDETFLEANGNISAGLLGISYGSLSESYRERGCDVIAAPDDLKDAKKNLKCGFAIISKWTHEHNYLALNKKIGASIYWSTLRSPYSVTISFKRKSKLVKQIVTVGKKSQIIAGLKKQLPQCF